jgi:hypothetical protein
MRHRTARGGEQLALFPPAEHAEREKPRRRGTRWIIQPKFRRRTAVSWCRRWLEGYDLSRLDWVRIDEGRGRYEGAYGRCWFPEGDKAYRISCQVPGPFPCHQRIYLRPVYRLADGSWEPRPKGARVSQHWASAEGREWLTVYRKIPLNDRDEAIVWMIGHEAFHYLRRTRQVAGRNVEWQADAFACNLLERWRAERPLAGG